jgi:radical SAM protein with 4Fe4S-binding SPASM domain
MAEMTIKKYIYSRGVQEGVPVSGTFELTPRCNLDCKMCYIHSAQRDDSVRMKELTTEQWLQIGQQAIDAGMVYLLLTGGEPMLRPDFTKIYTELTKKGTIISINTNGTVLSQTILDTFIKFPPERVNVTLYGTSSKTYDALCGNSGGYEAAKRNIQALKNAGVNVAINTTFTRLNADDMKEIVAFAKELDIPVSMAAYLFPSVRGGCGAENVFLEPEELGRLSALFDLMTLPESTIQSRVEMLRETEKLKKEWAEESRAAKCTAGRGSFWITWDGSMLPCGMLNDGVPVVELGFRDAWLRTKENIKRYLLPQECLNCKHQAVCPSCVAVAVDHENNVGFLKKELCNRTMSYVHNFLRMEKAF